MKLVLIGFVILVLVSLAYSFFVSTEVSKLRKETINYEKSTEIQSLQNDGEKLLLKVCALTNGTMCDEQTGDRTYRFCCKDKLGNRDCVSKEVTTDTPRLC